MELRHLRYFVAVAEEQNVTRAATRVHISQPALSRQIRDLEEELGIELFVRGANAVRLTEAGQAFLQDCRAILAGINAAVSKARRNQCDTVRVGYAASPTAEILIQVLKRFEAAHPFVTVTLHGMTSRGLVEGLRKNAIDVALAVSLSAREFAGLAVEDIGAYEARVAFPKGHRFEQLRRVPLAEIAREPLVALARDEHPEARAGLLKILSAYVDAPTIAMECDGALSLVAAVESGKGIALDFRTLSIVAGKRIVLRPVSPAPPLLPIAVVYRKERLAPAAASFVEVVTATTQGKARLSGKPLLAV